MMLEARTAHVKSQLTLKGAIRSTAKMQKVMASGAMDLTEMPRRLDFADGEDGMAQWCDEVDERSGTFCKSQRASLTSEEHDRYMWIFNEYLKRQGHGSFVVRTDAAVGVTLAPRTSSTGLLAPTVDEATGKINVVKPQMLVAYVLDMACGSPETPKGGHALDEPWRSGRGIASGQKLAWRACFG